MNLQQQRLAEGFLFTDMYQLTMAQLYFRQGLHEKRAQFNHFFRHYPDYGAHKAGYCLSAGLGWFLDWIESAKISPTDLEVLRSQQDSRGQAVFSEDFLQWLEQHGDFSQLDIRAIPEGRVIHPNTPVTIVEGPLALAQIVETALLTQLNFQILIASKAARIRQATQGRPVLEFGVRRAHDRGANAGARAALIGGADFTSNVGISHILGYQAKGTHAHSLVQVFMALGMSELDAFRAYAEQYPDNAILLVDTVNTLKSGVPNALIVFEELRAKGVEPRGIRIDSGDLAFLSIQAAKLLDEAGFPEVDIVLSSNLDELVIWQIITQIREEAPLYHVNAERVIQRLVYGVGTRLITSEGDSSLGGVYKLVAMQDGGQWHPAIKISNSPGKTPNPGNKNLWRIYDERGYATADVVSLEDEVIPTEEVLELFHPAGSGKKRVLRPETIQHVEPLLETVQQGGKRLHQTPSIDAMRQRRDDDLARLDPGVRRIINPHVYHVSLTKKLWQLKDTLLKDMKK